MSSDVLFPSGFDDPTTRNQILAQHRTANLIRSALDELTKNGLFKNEGDLKDDVRILQAYIYYGLKPSENHTSLAQIDVREIDSILAILESIAGDDATTQTEIEFVLYEVIQDLGNLKNLLTDESKIFSFSGDITEGPSTFEALMTSRLPSLYSKMILPISVYRDRPKLIKVFRNLAKMLRNKYPDSFDDDLVIDLVALQDLEFLIISCLTIEGNVNEMDLYWRFGKWCNSNITFKTDEQLVTSDEHFVTESSEFEPEESEKTFLGTLIKAMIENAGNMEMINGFCRMIYLGLTLIEGDKLINRQDVKSERNFLLSLLKEIKYVHTESDIYKYLNTIFEDLVNDCEIKEREANDPEGESSIAIVDGKDFENLLYRMLPSIYSHLSLRIDFVEMRKLLLQLFEILKWDFEIIFKNKNKPTELKLYEIRNLAKIIGYWVENVLSKKNPEEYSYALQELHMKILPRLLVWSGTGLP